MPKRGKREPSFHYLGIRVTQAMTRLHKPTYCAMIPVSDNSSSVMTTYQSVADKLNSTGPTVYELLAIVTVNKPSKSSALLKLLSSTPDAQEIQATMDKEADLEVLFHTALALA